MMVGEDNELNGGMVALVANAGNIASVFNVVLGLFSGYRFELDVASHITACRVY